MTYTYLTTKNFSSRIKYDISTIRNQLKDSVLIEGIHYIRPFEMVAKFFTFGSKLKKDMRKSFASNINAMTLQ